MKTRLLLTLSLVLLVGIIWAQPGHYGCRHGNLQGYQRPLTTVEKQLLQAGIERSDTFDIINYEINLEVLDFVGRTIKGYCEVTVTPKMNSQDSLVLDLLNLQIDSIVGPLGTLTYNYDGLFLRIALNPIMNIGDTAEIKVYYHGQLA